MFTFVYLTEVAIKKFASHRARVGVLGLGYAGLPLACCFAEAGFASVGFDIDAAKIAQLAQGRSYIEHIPHARVAALTSSATLLATSDFTELSGCDAAIICVPTPLSESKEPELTAIVRAASEIARRLHPGQLVVLESTSYPGTTEEVMLPILARSGLEVGKDFFLAFASERENPGSPDYPTAQIPKIVGGVTANCLEVASSTYAQIIKRIVPVSSSRVAEASKLIENVYRCVNVATINELKLMFDKMGIDVWEVIAAGSTKPFGFTPFYPGPGVGGLCIPIDPVYLGWKARQHNFPARFIELAGEINASMPSYVVDRLAVGLESQDKRLKDASVLLIGVSYKRDIDDIRESPAIYIIELLQRRMAQVGYHDPHVLRLRLPRSNRELSSMDLSAAAVASADAVVIVTDHRSIDYELIVEHGRLIVDTRNVTAHLRKPGDKIITV